MGTGHPTARAGSLGWAYARLDLGCGGAVGSCCRQSTICCSRGSRSPRCHQNLLQPSLPTLARAGGTRSTRSIHGTRDIHDTGDIHDIRDIRDTHPRPAPPASLLPSLPPSRGVFQLLATVLSQKASAQESAVGDGPAKAQDIPAGACCGRPAAGAGGALAVPWIQGFVFFFIATAPVARRKTCG